MGVSLRGEVCELGVGRGLGAPEEEKNESTLVRDRLKWGSTGSWESLEVI